MRLIALMGCLSILVDSSRLSASPPDRHSLVRRGQQQSGHHKLSKRSDSFSGKATFYATGLGACGFHNVDNDFIVALNKEQYEANKWCKKTITINYGGKSAKAMIMDECPGCPFVSDYQI
ncbi:hypothetical protein BY996DRAFT_4594978 [Phakopsora pachyrhizi]|nr:hypothetical protein BY996DRAFT_4594978 [Phakopsora pachyrhizi]